MVSETPASLVSLVGVFLCYKLDILVTNLCRIFHYNRINSVLMMKIFHYKGNNLIFHRIFKGITLFLMFKLSPFLYTRTKYVHFLI